MHSSPRSKDTTQVWLRGCCPTPILKVPEPEKPDPKPTNTSAACRRSFTSSTATSLFPNTYFTSHESIPPLQESFLNFIETYPKYSDTGPVDQIRDQEYSHLSLSNHVCLDYIGVGLFSQSQVESQSSSIIIPPPSPRSDFALFGVTFKSASLKSELLHGGDGSGIESAIRKRVADFLNISGDDYSMVFTANKSSAFRLVAEAYPFGMSRKLLTMYDHASEALDTMISVSEKRGARLMAAEFKWPRMRVHSVKLRKLILRKKKKKIKRGLFVFPLQSRMSGTSYSYQWMTMAQEHGWHVLLDACALGPKDMDSFGLSLFKPDFLVCSFYKVFGENPTGFGCLFVKKSVVPSLEESACGGIVSITPAFEDTENEGLDVQCRCLDHVDSLGLMLIGSRGRYLINWLVRALRKLRHPNRLDNSHLVKIYGPKVKFDRGPALAFNIFDWKGEKVEPVMVQKLAGRNNISLGHGVLNHIWFADKSEEEKMMVLEGNEGASSKNGKGDRGIKVVTIALTFLANFEDVYRVWAFVARFLDADFVEKERWRYTALNQKSTEV
ncbi:hypothetical protein CASFOL_010438 [Castilleja foliolosa]|uniref:Aminotransferase class V domain-containing protein n=1 Tax=Castilleja foliolosa TaxID=1961234 RepID=A0ABD3DT33_9LAMI